MKIQWQEVKSPFELCWSCVETFNTLMKQQRERKITVERLPNGAYLITWQKDAPKTHIAPENATDEMELAILFAEYLKEEK